MYFQCDVYVKLTRKTIYMHLYGELYVGKTGKKIIVFFKKYYIVTLTKYIFRNTLRRFAIYQPSGEKKKRNIGN